MSELKNKFNRKPDQAPPKKKGNVEVISQLVNNDTVNTSIQETVNTEKKVKKATFELDVGFIKGFVCSLFKMTRRWLM